MNCREFNEFLMAYLDGDLPTAQRSLFEQHMETCPPCVEYLNTYQQAVLMGKVICACVEDDVPQDVPEQLVQAILTARRAS